MSAKEILMAAAGASGAAITFVGAGYGENTTVTTLVINKPAGVVEGDLMVALMGSPKGAVWTMPSGWTRAAGMRSDTGSTPGMPALGIAYKIATASEPSTYTFTPDDTEPYNGVILAYRNAVVDGVNVVASDSAGAITTNSSVATYSNSLLLAVFAQQTTSASTFSTPTSMDVVVTPTRTTAPAWGIFSQTVAAGAVAGKTSTPSGVGTTNGALIVLAPAGSPVPTPTFIAAASTQNAAAGASLTINKPAGTTTGDLLIAFVGSDSKTTSWTPPAGWTEVADQGASPSLGVAYKIATASEGASYTFTASNATAQVGGAILTYRNASYSAISAITASAASSYTIPTQALAVNRAALLGVALTSGGNNTFGVPTNMTNRVALSASSRAPSLAVSDENPPGVGTFGGQTISSSGSSGFSVSVALTPT